MKDQWTKIYSSNYIHKVEIAQAYLESSNIESVIVNKQDSNYFFGEIELHVNVDQAMEANQILSKQEL
ncbi:MAG: DUF2007 domain-containing protein [Bacteroidetes bacterium]|nr:DUF2007 domain-containing protein [Bacteroidota bacterium]